MLLDVEPVETMRLFHALALPAGAALLLVAPYLLASAPAGPARSPILLMLALGVFDLLKGLDFEETALTWGTAALLIAARRAFTVRHDPITLRSALWRVPLLGLGGLAVAALATWASQGHPSLALGHRRDRGPAALAARADPLRAHDPLPPPPTPGSRSGSTRSSSGRCWRSPT